MEMRELLNRLHGLEHEIEQLKADLQPNQQNGFFRRCKDGLQFLVSNWVLVTVFLGFTTAVIGILVYDVNPFENFESIKTRRDLSEFYREQGDRLLERQYYEAAADVFTRAIQINPNNIDATYGLAKAELFTPDEGQIYIAPGIIDAKLASLLEDRPKDHQLHLLKGFQYQSHLDYENAKASFRHAIELREDFVYGYIALGFNNQYNLNSDAVIQETIGYYAKALELDPNNTDALSNLGYMYMLTGQFDTGFGYLEKSYHLAVSLVSSLDLGEAELYRGNFDRALELHKWALTILTRPGMDNDESFMGGGWLYNYMPSTLGDITLIRYLVEANTPQEKQVFLHYALSFDYALTGDLDQADRAFNTAYELDQSRMYNAFFAYKMLSLENFLSDSLDKETRLWFEAHRTQLWAL